MLIVRLFNNHFAVRSYNFVIKSACILVIMDQQELSPIPAENFTQTITFKGSDTNYSVQIVAQEVSVNCSTGNHNHGSSKVKLSNVVDYNWEQRFYTGHLLTVHVSGKYFAYGIKVYKDTSGAPVNPSGKGAGIVRVVTHDSSMRAIIKELSGQVQDLAFAHIFREVMLACVDEEGSLFVYNIEQTERLVCTLLLHVTQTECPGTNPSLHRVVWCPFLPEEDDTDDDASKLLVLTHGNKAQLLNIALINAKHGAGPLRISDIEEGCLEINEHSQPIMDAAFSPDGTAVATASMDGFVKFFQIYMHEGTKPRCLHEWQPHDGKPLSCLSFLDNHNIYGADEQFWKFAITGCHNNTELKIWSCESWSCLQTITFVPSRPSHEIFLKVRLDLSAGYLLLSDIENRVLYILEIHKDRNGTNAFARSISEFLLPAPVLSFGILEATLRKFRCSNSTEDLYPCDENDDFDDGQNIVATVVRMFVIQPKRLQECQIVFQPESGIKLTAIPSPLTHKKRIFPEGLSEIIADKIEHIDTPIRTPPNDTVDPLTQLTNILQADKHFNDLQNLLIQPSGPLNLMTPDAFNSPAKDPERDSPLSNSSPIKTPIPESEIPTKIDSNGILGFQRTQKDFASGGSSPSREVQEILALNNTSFTEYYEEDAIKTEVVNEVQKTATPNTYQTNSNVIYNEANLNADGWPSIPILKATEVVKINSEELNVGEGLKEIGSDASVHTLQEWVRTLMEMVREQNAQLEQLQVEVKSLKFAAQEKCTVPGNLENIVGKQLDLALARSHAQQSKLFEHWANARANKDREHQDALAINLTHSITMQLHEKLQAAVNIEMKQTVLPKVVATFESLKLVLKEDFVQKLANSDLLIRENLNKFVNSKALADSITTSIVNVLKPSIEKCYREVINSTLLPSWEKVCNNMFQQLNETFTAGTKEYTQSLENYLDKSHRRTQDKGKEMVVQMQGLCDIMRTNTDKLYVTLPTEIQKQVVTSMTSMEDKLTNNMSEVIQNQVETAFKNHASVLEDSVINAVRSRAVTPSPLDTQVQLTQIQQLLTQGYLNTAFQQALSASDLSLVMYICERLNPQVVFSQSPCPLQQHVLLSLIQQLSADMANQTDLKIRYLEEAVLNLDPSYPVTKEHMSTVLRELLRQLVNFTNANPNHKIVRKMKMLQMAAQSLLKT